MKKIGGNTVYKWIICASCTFILFINVGFTSSAFGIHLPYIMASGNYSNSQISMIITLKTLSNLVGIFYADRYVERFGLRRGIAAALAAGTAGFLCMGAAKGLALYYVGGLLMGLASGLGGFMVVSILINNWFSENIGLALGVCSAGSGIALILLPLLVTGLISSSGLGTAFYVEAALEAAAFALALLVLRDKAGEETAGGMPDAADDTREPETAKNNAQHGASLRHSIGNSRLLVAAAAAAMLFTGWGSNIPNYFTMLYIGSGYDDIPAARMFSAIGIILTVWKLVFGRLNDKAGTRISAIIAYLLLSAGCAAACFCGLRSAVINAAAVFCIATGLITTTVLISCLAIDLSSAEVFKRMLRIMNTAFWVGILLGSYVTGLMADHFGSYIQSFALCGALSLAALALLLAVYKVQHEKTNG
jgi:MFS family permease